MKTAVLIVLVLLVLIAPAASQTPDDKLIVPGIRVGKWTLKMNINDLEKMNGPAQITSVSSPDMRHEYTFYVWGDLDFGADTVDRKEVELLVAGFRGTVLYRIDKGIGFQSTRADLLNAYGKPTAETVPRQGQKNVIYDAIGIDFQVYDGGTIREMRIFRPGAAKSIWKF